MQQQQSLPPPPPTLADYWREIKQIMQSDSQFQQTGGMTKSFLLKVLAESNIYWRDNPLLRNQFCEKLIQFNLLRHDEESDTVNERRKLPPHWTIRMGQISPTEEENLIRNTLSKIVQTDNALSIKNLADSVLSFVKEQLPKNGRGIPQAVLLDLLLDHKKVANKEEAKDVMAFITRVRKVFHYRAGNANSLQFIALNFTECTEPVAEHLYSRKTAYNVLYKDSGKPENMIGGGASSSSLPPGISTQKELDDRNAESLATSRRRRQDAEELAESEMKSRQLVNTIITERTKWFEGGKIIGQPGQKMKLQHCLNAIKQRFLPPDGVGIPQGRTLDWLIDHDFVSNKDEAKEVMYILAKKKKIFQYKALKGLLFNALNKRDTTRSPPEGSNLDARKSTYGIEYRQTAFRPDYHANRNRTRKGRGDKSDSESLSDADDEAVAFQKRQIQQASKDIFVPTEDGGLAKVVMTLPTVGSNNITGARTITTPISFPPPLFVNTFSKQPIIRQGGHMNRLLLAPPPFFVSYVPVVVEPPPPPQQHLQTQLKPSSSSRQVKDDSAAVVPSTSTTTKVDKELLKDFWEDLSIKILPSDVLAPMYFSQVDAGLNKLEQWKHSTTEERRMYLTDLKKRKMIDFAVEGGAEPYLWRVSELSERAKQKRKEFADRLEEEARAADQALPNESYLNI